MVFMMVNNHLVGGLNLPTPLKKILEFKSVGMTFPYIWKVITAMFQSPPTSHDWQTTWQHWRVFLSYKNLTDLTPCWINIGVHPIYE